MGASSITRGMLARTDIRRWAWWQLPMGLRCYVGLAVLTAVGLTGFAASQTTWRGSDLAKYVVLLGCSMVAVAAKPGAAYRGGGLTRDFLSSWVLPVAIVLPPIYAMMAPIPLQVLTQMRVHKGVVYRRVFTVAVMGQCYGAASLLFRAFPATFAGNAIGTGTHALTWVVAVVICELVGGRGSHILIAAAVKIADPEVRARELLGFNLEALQADFAESDLGILITVVVGVNPALELFAVPTVLLIRRFMMHEQLLAQSRIDMKTGLLNASTWETEATAEVTRAIRTHSPLSLALIDIDHFKRVNDTHGHLVGDKVLRAVTDAIQQHLRGYDLAGRFGGEEFVVLLPQARQADAVNIAERLRTHIAAMSIPVHDSPVEEPAADPSHNGKGRSGRHDAHVRLTISVGVAALSDSVRELNGLMAAADSALYHAKQTGRNKTSVVWSSEAVSLGAASEPVSPRSLETPSTSSNASTV